MKVVIWGGSSGMGAALAKRYFTKGHEVIIISRTKDLFLENFQGQFRQIKHISCDITDSQAVDLCIKAQTQEKPIDIYIVSSGIGVNKKERLENFEMSKKIFQVNALGTLNAVSSVFDSMYEQRDGHIVLLGSLAGVRGLPLNAGYCASKAAVHAMGESWAGAWREFGIKITTVAPGFVDTPMTQGNQHHMPFLTGVRDAAQIISEAVEAEKSFIAFPKLPYFVMKILAFLPAKVSEKIIEWIKPY